MTKFLRITGYINISSGMLILAFWYLYAILLPYSKLSTTLSILVLDRDWTLVNILGSLGSLLGILGLVGLYFSLEDEISTVATAGFLIAMAGSILMFVALMRDTIMWPILAKHDPSLLDFTGPIYTSKTFVPFFIFSGLLYAAGYVIFGLALANSSLFPQWAGHLMAWGALLFAVGAMFGSLQVYIRSVGLTALTIGTIWLGYLLIKLSEGSP
jgi:hypothetical protein